MPQTVTVSGGSQPGTILAEQMENATFYVLTEPVYQWRVGDLIVRTADRVANTTQGSYDDRLRSIRVRPLRAGERIIIEGG